MQVTRAAGSCAISGGRLLCAKNLGSRFIDQPSGDRLRDRPERAARGGGLPEQLGELSSELAQVHRESRQPDWHSVLRACATGCMETRAHPQHHIAHTTIIVYIG